MTEQDKRVKSMKRLTNHDVQTFSSSQHLLEKLFCFPHAHTLHKPDVEDNFRIGNLIENCESCLRYSDSQCCVFFFLGATRRCQEINFNDFKSGIILSVDDVKEFHLSFLPPSEKEFHHSLLVVCLLCAFCIPSCKLEQKFPLQQ